MAPVILFLLFVPLMAFRQGIPDNEIEIDEPSDVSEIISKANAGLSNLIHDDIVPNRQRNADPCTATGCLWPKSSSYVIVPVSISSDYDRAERNIIIQSLITFHKSTCVRFVWRRWWHKQYLHIFSGSGCWSYVGRSTRGQPLSLRKNGCLYTSIVQHEILHALGFHHEHVRSDRDTHVNILYQNIQTGRENNFQKVETNNLGTPYDFDSVMHYSKYAFSKNRQPTILARSDPSRNFGRAAFMSENDIARVNRLYRCDV